MSCCHHDLIPFHHDLDALMLANCSWWARSSAITQGHLGHGKGVGQGAMFRTIHGIMGAEMHMLPWPVWSWGWINITKLLVYQNKNGKSKNMNDSREIIKLNCVYLSLKWNKSGSFRDSTNETGIDVFPVLYSVHIRNIITFMEFEWFDSTGVFNAILIYLSEKRSHWYIVLKIQLIIFLRDKINKLWCHKVVYNHSGSIKVTLFPKCT